MSRGLLHKALDLQSKGQSPTAVARECGLSGGLRKLQAEVEERIAAGPPPPRGRAVNIIVPGEVVDAIRKRAKARGVPFAVQVADILVEAFA